MLYRVLTGMRKSGVAPAIVPALLALAVVGLFAIASIASVTAASPTHTLSPAWAQPTGNTSPITLPASGSTTECGNWELVTVSHPGPDTDNLNGVAALSANDVWAVGSYSSGPGDSRAVVQHWNGTQWSVVPSPSIPSSGLRAVAAVSTNDVWAAGFRYGTRGAEPLMERWNGTQWSVVPSPLVTDARDHILYGLGVVSASDIWAVGYYETNNYQMLTLTMHWNGQAWNIVPSPNLVNYPNTLRSVSAVSGNDVWAVGDVGSDERTVAMHWDGSEWTMTNTNNPGHHNSFNGVVALSATSVWAVGGFENDGNGSHPLVSHWDGVSWTQVQTPYEANSTLYAVSAAGEGDIWAVGSRSADTLTMHWDGARWATVPSPDISSYNSILYSVSVLPGGDAWSVGSYTNDTNYYRGFAERYTNTCPGPSPTATPPAACNSLGIWSAVTSPNPFVEETYIEGIAAVTSNDLWAVGYHQSSPSSSNSTILHWNATDWSVSLLPSQPGSNKLYAVAAIAPNNVLAVGYRTYNMMDTNHIMRWDGTQWSTVSTPSPGYTRNYLYGVSALGADNVWAVGKFYDNTAGAERTLVLHWDGGAWDILPSPNVGQLNNTLRAVKALSADNVWAVGYYSASTGGTEQTLTMHWNGVRWDVVESPNSATGSSYLTAIDGSPTGGMWAVGNSLNPVTGVSETLAMRWEGTGWSLVTSQNPGSAANVLNGVSVTSGEAWAVGSYRGASGDAQTLILRWDGSLWSQVPSPNPSARANSLNAVVALSRTEAWAVGSQGSAGATGSLTARYRNTMPPCPSPTPPPPTPTPCTAYVYSDVPQGSVFYAYVTCLALHGIISGYSDCMFRPNNLVTRGQLAKIVSNAANFHEDPGAQIFEDVAPDNTFYQWINRLTRRSYMGGYTCGSPGEPCVNGGRPYFRPAANATRAQTSKIVSNAAQYSDTPTEQTFEDVPTTHSFYEWIQRLASHGAMGGYQCGGPGEPCSSGNKPYFRPGNNVTRGQSAKIVANTFYPGCQPFATR